MCIVLLVVIRFISYGLMGMRGKAPVGLFNFEILAPPPKKKIDPSCVYNIVVFEL